MATLSEITEVLKNLANAYQTYREVPEDAAGLDSTAIAAALETGMTSSMKDGLAMAVELVSTSNDDSLDNPLTPEQAEAVGNFHVLRRNVLALLNPPPVNRASRRRETKVSRKAK